MVAGIYLIKNAGSGKVYVGSGVDVENRWSSHRAGLNAGNHFNAHLQRAWNRYGVEAFSFVLVERCVVNRLQEREQWWIDNLHATSRGYNLAPYARSSFGIKRTDTTRARLSAAAVRVGSDPEERKRRSERAKWQHAQGKLGWSTRRDRHPKLVIICGFCQQEFRTYQATRTFCSQACSNRMRGVRNRARYVRVLSGEGRPRALYKPEMAY